PGIFGDDLWSCDVITVFRSIGNGISHAFETGLINQVYDQFHLMDTLEICVSRIISCLAQGLETSLHQCASTAAQHCLFTEQVCLGLCTEGCLQNTCSRSADSQRICQSQIQCFSGVILLNRYQTRSTFSSQILTSYGMARSLWSDHGYVYICRRFDLSEMNIK